MLKLKRFTVIISLIFLFALLFTTCGPTVVVRKPPPPRTEVRSSKPRPGKKWASGHWVKRPRGWVWVKGHWR